MQLWQLTSCGFLLWLRWIVIAGIAVYLALMGLILSYSYTDADYSEDIVIVLGAGVTNGKVSKVLQNRLDACIDYYHKNSSIHIVVAGGPTRLKDGTEADAMAKYLAGHGVPQDIIILEDKSQSTLENYKFTKQILESRNICHNSIVFVTNDFHIYRAKKYAEYCGFETAHALSTKTDLFTFVPALTREVLGVIDMWTFKLR
ncbi:MAG: YdcF family protein [Oscillospiraceae bacterium]|nr:YdcF family protein [Oscillospiraceae bacterium]